MRHDTADSVTPGGPPAPPGARGPGARGLGLGPTTPAGGDPGDAPAVARLGGPTRLVVALLAASLAVYAAVAADVVNSGRLSELDVDVATWVARSMPTWAEWLARPFTWLGGAIGLTAVVVAAVTWLLARQARAAAVLLVVVTIGIQLIVVAAKNGYDRPRPDVGSAIALPASFSFPSGHAANGIAVLGLLGLILGSCARTRRARVAAIVAGFGVGALVGVSRVVLDVHYVSDVVAGGCLGLAWLVTCLLGTRVLCSRRPRAGARTG